MTSFAEAAELYFLLGWDPLPLPAGEKNPPPSGFTGRAGRDVTDELLEEWASSWRKANLALRMPPGVVGVDVDQYTKNGHDKTGQDTMDMLVARLGELPPTWRSSARGAENPSGQRFYRVSAGTELRNGLPGIEFIQRHHRYTVAWPSTNPDAAGAMYRWYRPDGSESDTVPTPLDFPWLPEAWVAHLRSDRAHPEKGTEQAGAVLQRTLEDAGGDPCDKMAGLVRVAVGKLADNSGSSRHDMMLRYSEAIVAAAVEGHSGFAVAHEQLRDAFIDAVGPDRPAEGEFERMVTGALCIWSGSDAASVDPCSAAADFEVLPPSEDDIFGATPILERLKQTARAQTVSPLAMLGCVLARVVSEIPVRVVLPPVVGGFASLNTAVALVGPSGSSKTSSNRVAGLFLYGPEGHPANRPRPRQIGAGSGEGIVQSFLTRGSRTEPATLLAYPHSLMVVDEIGRLDAVKSRNGSSAAAVLRSALTGDDLSMTNSEISRDREVPELSYRFALITGVQPGLSDVLLNPTDEAAGTPQRYLWLPANDPNAPDDKPALPEPINWEPPFRWDDDPDRLVLTVAPEIQQVIRQAATARVRGEGNALDGHALLTREKVTAALAFLHGDAELTVRWWELAGLIMEQSDQVRRSCLQELQRNADQEAVSIGRRRGLTEASAEVSKAASRATEDNKWAALLWRQVDGHSATAEPTNNRKHPQSEGCTRRCLSHALRNHMKLGLDVDRIAAHAEAQGWIEQRDGRWLPGESAPAMRAVKTWDGREQRTYAGGAE